MRYSGLFCSIRVSDIEKSLAFYGILGFILTEKFISKVCSYVLLYKQSIISCVVDIRNIIVPVSYREWVYV